MNNLVLSSFLGIAFLAMSAYPQVVQAIDDPDEAAVRNAYAKVEFKCGLPPLTNAAIKQLQDAQVTQESLNNRVADATPIFNLSSFRTGTIASIASRPWSDFVTPPQQGGQVLEGFSNNRYYASEGASSSWSESEVRWAPSHTVAAEAEAHILAMTVAEVIAHASPQWSSATVTYTRYVAFTVDATYQGKSTGPHKAIFLFGTDTKGNEVIAQNDLISGGQVLWDSLKQPSYPAGLLQSRLRETTVVANWIRQNEIPSSTCSSSSTADLCCVRGKCGLSSFVVEKDLATPIATNGVR